MTSHLYKLEGAGNDFVLGIGDWAERLATTPALVARLCRRRFGIGGDGALAVFADGARRLRLVYRNADGSPADFCANGTRCAARAGVELLGLEPDLVVETGWVDVPAVVRGSAVTLTLPPPTDAPRRMTLAASGTPWTAWLLEIGVPHLVIEVDMAESFDLAALAPPLRRHSALSDGGANVNVVHDDDDGRLVVRTWERGVENETLACGSGVVAAALVSMAQRRIRILEVVPRSGQILQVEALGEPPECGTRLTGPAHLLAELSPCEELLAGF